MWWSWRLMKWRGPNSCRQSNRRRFWWPLWKKSIVLFVASYSDKPYWQASSGWLNRKDWLRIDLYPELHMLVASDVVVTSFGWHQPDLYELLTYHGSESIFCKESVGSHYLEDLLTHAVTWLDGTSHESFAGVDYDWIFLDLKHVPIGYQVFWNMSLDIIDWSYQISLNKLSIKHIPWDWCSRSSKRSSGVPPKSASWTGMDALCFTANGVTFSGSAKIRLQYTNTMLRPDQ